MTIPVITSTTGSVRAALLRILAVLCLSVFSSSALAIDIQEVRSPKGVTAWLVEDYTVPIISLRFSFEGGTVQDPEGKEGLSYLMTGLFDEGAGDLNADSFQERLDVAAAEMGFSADQDAVSGSMRTLVETSENAFALLALAVNQPRFDQAPFERIRAQIISGIKAREKRPETLAARKWDETFYDKHPYARQEQGTAQSLSAIEPKDLHDLHARLFAKSKLHVGIVGAIDAQRVAILLDLIFGDLPNQPDLTPVADAKPAYGEKVIVDFPQPETTLRLAYPGIDRDDPKFFAAYLMNHILGGGSFSSRLYSEVREKRGLVYGVGSFLATREHAASLGISTSTRSDRAVETLKVIVEEVGKMAAEGPSEEELAAAKKYVLGAYAINNLDNSSSIANTLVGLQQEKLGIDYIDRREQLINAVGLKDVRDIAAELLTAKPTILVVGPDAAKVAATGE